MTVTEAGTMMLVRPELSKALLPMVTNSLPLSKLRLVKSEQSEKAGGHMVVTEAGMMMLVRPEY